MDELSSLPTGPFRRRILRTPFPSPYIYLLRCCLSHFVKFVRPKFMVRRILCGPRQRQTLGIITLRKAIFFYMKFIVLNIAAKWMICLKNLTVIRLQIARKCILPGAPREWQWAVGSGVAHAPPLHSVAICTGKLPCKRFNSIDSIHFQNVKSINSKHHSRADWSRISPKLHTNRRELEE